MNVPEKDPTLWEQMIHLWPATLIALLVSSVGGVIAWIVRNILTNQKKLIRLETEINEREKAAKRGREDLRELKGEFRHMNTTLMAYFSKDKET